MATTAFSRLFAVTAAVLIVLSGCGGNGNGGDESSVPANAVKSVAEAPSGRVVDLDSRPRMQALSAPTSVVAALTPVIDFSYVVSEGATKPVLAKALAAAEAPSIGTITWDQLADYVERTLPDLFPGHQQSYALADFTVRRYDLPNDQVNYIGVTPDGRVWGYGQFTGYTLVQYWDLATWTGPRLATAKIVSNDGQSVEAGTSEVSSKDTKLVLGYDKPLGCAGVSGTRKVGAIIATIVCDAAAKTVTVVPGLPGEPRWPSGTKNTVTVGGLFGQDGLPGPQATVSFTTRPPTSAGVFVGNALGNSNNLQGLSIVSQSGLVKSASLAGSHQFMIGGLAAAPSAGVLYVAPMATQVVYRVDIETGALLESLDIGGPGGFDATRSIASSETQTCVVLGALGIPEYSWWGKPICWNHQTRERVEGSVGLIDATKLSTGMHYSRNTQSFYSLNATTSGFVSEFNGSGGRRDGFAPGTVGTVTEFSCEATCQIKRTFVVGSVPQGVAENEARRWLYIANSGDVGGSISIIDLRQGTVVTRSLGWSGWRHPMKLLYDPTYDRLLVSDYQSRVVALDPVTLAEVGGVTTGDLPMNMTFVGADEIWATLFGRNVFEAGDSVAVLDRRTLVLKRVIPNVGPRPFAIIAP